VILKSFVIGPPGQEVDLLPMVVKQAAMFQRSVGSADYDDAISEAVLHTIRGLHRYDPSKGTRFSTFAFPCIRGAALDLARRETRYASKHELRQSIEDLDLHSYEDEDRDTRILTERVMAVMDRCLAPKLAAVLRLTYLSGWSDREIARELGIRVSAVEKVRAAALQEVRRLLQDSDLGRI